MPNVLVELTEVQATILREAAAHQASEWAKKGCLAICEESRDAHAAVEQEWVNIEVAVARGQMVAAHERGHEELARKTETLRRVWPEARDLSLNDTLEEGDFLGLPVYHEIVRFDQMRVESSIMLRITDGYDNAGFFATFLDEFATGL